MRTETRREKILAKQQGAATYPVGITAVNFMNDENIAFLIRAAACFGASRVNIIGDMPSRSKIKSLTGSTFDYVTINKYHSVEQYLHDAKAKIFCCELVSNAQELSDVEFPLDEPVDFVIGHETIGVPGVLCTLFPCIYIDMPGVGPCLNNSQTANIMLYEYSRRQKKVKEL